MEDLYLLVSLALSMLLRRRVELDLEAVQNWGLVLCRHCSQVRAVQAA